LRSPTKPLNSLRDSSTSRNTGAASAYRKRQLRWLCECAGTYVLPLPAHEGRGSERLSIVHGDRGFRVLLQRSSGTRSLGLVTHSHEAFTRAERWVANNRPDAKAAMAAAASWRDKPPTPAQLSLLQRAGCNG
jgi:hypothetical protein